MTKLIPSHILIILVYLEASIKIMYTIYPVKNINYVYYFVQHIFLQAEAIQSLAIRVFEDISVDGLQRFHLESLPTNAPLAASSRIPQVEPPTIIGHARFRHILHSGK